MQDAVGNDLLFLGAKLRTTFTARWRQYEMQELAQFVERLNADSTFLIDKSREHTRIDICLPGDFGLAQQTGFEGFPQLLTDVAFRAGFAILRIGQRDNSSPSVNLSAADKVSFIYPIVRQQRPGDLVITTFGSLFRRKFVCKLSPYFGTSGTRAFPQLLRILVSHSSPINHSLG